MLKRFTVAVGSAVFTSGFTVWAFLKLVLDDLGRADIVTALGAQNSIMTKMLLWLFATPWWVPAILAFLAIASWVYLTHMLLLPRPVAVSSGDPEKPEKAVVPTKVPSFKRSPYMEHELNAKALAAGAPLSQLTEKVRILSLISDKFFIERLGALSHQLRGLSKKTNYQEWAQQAKKEFSEFKQEVDSYLQQFKRHEDVMASATIWGFDEAMESIDALLSASKQVQSLSKEKSSAIVEPYIDQMKSCCRNFLECLEETERNIRYFRHEIKSRLADPD